MLSQPAVPGNYPDSTNFQALYALKSLPQGQQPTFGSLICEHLWGSQSLEIRSPQGKAPGVCRAGGLSYWPDLLKRAQDLYETARQSLHWAGKDQPVPNNFLQENLNMHLHALNKFAYQSHYSKCIFFFQKRRFNFKSVKLEEIWWYLSCTAGFKKCRFQVCASAGSRSGSLFPQPEG